MSLQTLIYSFALFQRVCITEQFNTITSNLSPYIYTIPQSADHTSSLSSIPSSSSEAPISEDKIAEDKISEDNILNSITDEEALLACHAYVRRKRKSEWKENNDRKLAKISSERNGEIGGAGYFWDDPSELIYLQSTPRSMEQLNQLEQFDDNAFHLDMTDPFTPSLQTSQHTSRQIYNQETRQGKVSGPGSRKCATFSNENIDYSSSEELSSSSIIPITLQNGNFTGFSSTPPASHLRRSRAARKLFSNPDWKRQWYARRWGANYTSRARHNQHLAKVRALPRSLLSSPELVALSEEELTTVIRDYVVANRKRAASHKAMAANKGDWIRERLEGGDEEFRESFSVEGMERKRRERSERAKRAYRTRLANQKRKNKGDSDVFVDSRGYRKISAEKRTKDVVSKSKKGMSPAAAIYRIEMALAAGERPSSEDVTIIMAPTRLSKRRELLMRVLRECFNLMGKCVPQNPSLGSDSPMVFCSNCKLSLLGSFVISKLDDNDNNNNDDDDGEA